MSRRPAEPGQRLEVVAAFEHRGDARCKPRRTTSELGEDAGRELEPGERVVSMRVEAGRDQEQLGLECRDRALRASERFEITDVASSRREWDVQERLALLVGPAATGIERPLVQ